MPARYIFTWALTGIGRVQHTSTSLVLGVFFGFEGNEFQPPVVCSLSQEAGAACPCYSD